MKKLLKNIWMCLALGALVIQSQSFAANETKAEENKMTDAQMQEMMKKTQPNEAHKQLEPMVGKWQHTVTWWMNAGDKPQTMKGTNENTMIMEGRYLQQVAHGEPQKDYPAFEGMGVTGYDNIKGEYTSFWIDNMGTGMMTATASFDKKSKTFNEEGTFACPMTGEKNRSFRAKWTIVNKDMYKYEMFTDDMKTGKEFKSMEIAYKRAK